MLTTTSLNQELLQKLPPPLTITTSQIRSWYHSLYDKLLESYNSKDFIRIKNLLSCTQILDTFSYPLSYEDPSKDNLLADLASLIYKIITIYPVKYYQTQFQAASFFITFIESNKTIPGLKLEWKPLHKIINFYINESESKFLSGNKFLPRKKIVGLFLTPMLTFILQILQKMLSKYYINEEETKVDGLIVKTNTTEQLVKKFIPNVSTILKSDENNLYDFLNYFPKVKGEYKKFFDYFQYLLKDPQTFNNSTILNAFNEIVMVNIEDDFSCLLPFLNDLIRVTKISIKNFALFINLSNLLVSLFISPMTRQKTLDLLESYFISFKNQCHPSVTQRGSSSFFIDRIVTSLIKSLKKLSKKSDKKIYYNMDPKLGPSQEEIHKLLSMTSEIMIMNIQNLFNSKIVLIETTLDPLLIDRYFDIAIQCIDLTDAFNLAKGGWSILTALMMHIDTNEKLQANFENIFQMATNNLCSYELNDSISNFIAISLHKVPFNRKKGLKGLENTNFRLLSNSYFSNLISLLRTAPAAKDEPAEQSFGNTSYIILCIKELFNNCEPEIFEEILPIIESLAYDESIYQCSSQVELIVSNYCHYSSREQAMKVIKAFQSEYKSSDSNINKFRYISSVLSSAIFSAILESDSIKKSADLIFPYTNSDNEQIRKIAWKSVDSAFTISSFIYVFKIELKPEKMMKYPLENARLEDFNISYKCNPDITDIEYEALDPILDKLLEIKDQYELNNYYNDNYIDLVFIINAINLYTEGSQELINEVYNNSIFFIPETIKKSVPIKDKFIKVLNRIVNDFPENENLIDKVIISFKELVLAYFAPSSSELFEFFMLFEHSKKVYNKELLFKKLLDIFGCRLENYVYPLNDDCKSLLEKIINLTVSSSKVIREKCSFCITEIWSRYFPFIVPCLEKIIERKESIPIKNFVGFLSSSLNFEFLYFNDKHLCEVFLYLLKNFESNEKDKEFMLFLTNFLIRIKVDSPFETISEDSSEFLNLLNEIEKNYLNKNKPNRSFVSFLLDVIIVSLKHVKDINDNILSFVIKQIVHYDEQISVTAYNCLIIVLERREKYTKEKVQVKELPTILSMPNFLDKIITAKLPSNGYYFPSNLHTLKPTNSNCNDDNDHINETISTDYSVDVNPATSIDVNLDVTDVNKEIIKVFESFKNIEIETNITEKDKEILDSEFMINHSNGFFLFKDHYTHKKYEFVENKMLIKLIPDIFASAMASINESDLTSNISYTSIWSHYATTVGHFCIKKLAKLSRKYLSEYLSVNPEVTSIIVYDMVLGFLNKIFYWNIEDRINFIKLVALPVICVISSSPFITEKIKNLLSDPAKNVSIFSIAPIIKVMLELYDKGPNCDHFNSCFLNNIVNVIMNRRFFFFHLIEPLKAKYISPFIENMKDYKMNEISDISFLFFRLFDCCSIIPKSSPMYSNEIESKTVEMLSIFDSLFQKENINNCLIYFLINSFKFFNDSSFYTRILMAPVFIKNMKIIFNLLKNSLNSTGESFINSFKTFIENDVFFSDSKIQFDFLSTFITEMMNAPLPLQQILIENINVMLKNKIFCISKNDYEKFEEIIINYGKHVNMKNFDNEIRLKIAEILGIFELRKCSLKKSDIDFEKVASDEKLKEELILKAASIILDIYLFDRIDDRVIDALEIMEKLCMKTGKDKKNKIFFKKVVEVFVNRHSGHVINELEEILIQYKYMMSPSYIC